MQKFTTLAANLSPFAKTMIRIGAVSGALSVCLGAIGAHKLKKDLAALPPEKADHLQDMFRKAKEYHVMNSIMLIVSGSIAKFPKLSCPLFLAGIVLFSGPLYYQAFTQQYSILNQAAPFGGTCSILGWLSLLFI